MGAGRLASVKRLILMVVVLLATTSNSLAQASFETIDGLRYLIDSDAKTARVQKYSYIGKIIVPDKVTASDGNEYLVVDVGHAFSENGYITDVTLPSHITSLDYNCFFNCVQLSTIKLPDSIKTLGAQCFCRCINLKEISLPSTLISCGYNCFGNCRMESIVLPSSVTSLGTDCFAGSHIKRITIPSSVTSMGEYCFASCGNLDSVELPESITSLSYGCFYNCGCLSKITIPSSVVSFGSDCFKDTGLKTLTFKGICPTNALNGGMPTDCVIYVPKEYLQDYKDALGSKYSYIYALDDGTSTNILQVKTRGIVAISRDGIVTIFGLDNNEEVRFYSVDGKQIGCARSVDGVASQAVSAAANSLVIAKISGKSIKIAVK